MAGAANCSSRPAAIRFFGSLARFRLDRDHKGRAISLNALRIGSNGNRIRPD